MEIHLPDNIKKEFNKIKAQLNKETLIKHLTYLNVIGIIILIIGIYMLYYIYESSFYFILGFNGIDATWIIRLAYLIIIACIGGYFIKKAALLLGDPVILSLIIFVIGLAFLIFAFWTAQIFIDLQYQLNPLTFIGLLFFGIMVAIGLFFFGKGMSDLIKIRKQEKPQRTERSSMEIPPVEVKDERNSPTPDREQAEFKICPQCLSKLAPDDSHCVNCGKKQ
jgi:hypothetical protein